MDRKKFVFSWGRKMFFGFSWPLMSLLSLIYLQSGIFPKGPESLLFYVSSLLGHYGLIHILLYFLLYCPLVAFFPNYYFSRFWSFFLIIASNLLILSDSLIFITYRRHLDRLMFNLMFGDGSSYLQQLPSSLYIGASIAFLVLLGILWFRGDWVWRKMQTRFSNPVSNWYLVLITASVVISQVLYGQGRGQEKRISQLFPASFYVIPKHPDQASNGPYLQDIQLPEIKCEGKSHPNILFVIIEGWEAREFSPEQTPFLHHFLEHGMKFENHLSGGSDKDTGLFSILWSLPPNYKKPLREHKLSPLLLKELEKRGYSKVFFMADSVSVPGISFPENKSNERVNELWIEWSHAFATNKEEKPYFGLLYYDLLSPRDLSLSQTDALIADMIYELQITDLLKNTMIVITSTHSSVDNSPVPLIVIWPDRKSKVITHQTTHYDIAPTIMSDIWKCKTFPSRYSFGSSLFKPLARSWHVTGNDQVIEIIDWKNKALYYLEDNQFEVKDFAHNPLPHREAREGALLQAMKELNRFYKR